MADFNTNDSSNSSAGGENWLRNSPFGPLIEVLGDEGLANLFNNVDNGEGGGSPFGGSGSNLDLPYGGNPFAGDNFWNIFAGGVNPTKGVGNQGGTSDPLTGVGGSSTSEIPDSLTLRTTIDNLVNSKLKEQLGTDGIPSFDPSKIPSFDGSEIPSFDPSKIPSFGGIGTPSNDGSGIPSFDPSKIPSFGSIGIPSNNGSGIPSFGGGEIPFTS